MDHGWAYEAFPSRLDQGWIEGSRQGSSAYDNVDFHVDLGCGTTKKGRIGVDRFEAPGVDVVCDLEKAQLPFADSSIYSIITHHCLEHIGEGFVPLMQEIHRVLVADGLLRVIVPLFPSTTAVSDPDHKRYFMADSFKTFDVDDEGRSWMESFSVPYPQSAKFQIVEIDGTLRTPNVYEWWGPNDNRELRVAMRAWKP